MRCRSLGLDVVLDKVREIWRADGYDLATQRTANPLFLRALVILALELLKYRGYTWLALVT